MRRLSRFAILTVTALTLAACDPDREIGAGVDEGGFGGPTANNAALMTGQKNAAIELGKRFNRQVPDTVNFAFNSDRLDGQAQAILRQQADWIRQYPEVRFRVYGHTDRVGSDAYNRALGLRRAQAVVAFFATQGISRNRLEAVASFGRTRPVIDTPDPERRNRRTVVEVSGFYERHPTVLNGKYAAVIFREYVASATTPHPANTEVKTATSGE